MVKSLHREFVLAYMQLNPGLQRYLLRKYCGNIDRQNNETPEQKFTRLLNLIYSKGEINKLLQDIRSHLNTYKPKPDVSEWRKRMIINSPHYPYYLS